MDANTQKILQMIGKAMETSLPGEGYAVLVLKFGEPTLCNFVANVEIEAVKAGLLEVIARWEGRGHDAPERVQ